jgi:hypothetical protein
MYILKNPCTLTNCVFMNFFYLRLQVAYYHCHNAGLFVMNTSIYE